MANYNNSFLFSARKRLSALYGDGNSISISISGRVKSGYIFGNDECYRGDLFYQIFLSDDASVYRVYYDIPECDDIDLAFDMIDYSCPYDYDNITDEYLLLYS